MSMPADQIQALLAPYFQSGPNTGTLPAVAAPFGGFGNIGLQLLANSGPSPVRQRFGSILGNSMLQAQAQTLQQARARQELLSGSLSMAQQMAMLRMLSNPNPAGAGTGLPIDSDSSPAPDSTAGDSNQSYNGSPGFSSVTSFGEGASSPALQNRLTANAAPPGAAPLNSPNPAPPGAGTIQAPSAAPPGAPLPRPLIMPPGGSGQFPPGFSPFARASSPNWLTPPSAAQISGVPVGGFNPRTLQTLAVLRGGDPIITAKNLREQQVQIAQQRYAPAIARLDTLTKSDTPTRYVAADPSLMAAWQQTAPQLGFDPQKDFTDQNVRTAFSFVRNRLAGALSEGTVAPNVMLKSSPIGLGGTIQTDPVTGKVTTGAPQQDTASFVMPDGTVKLMTKAAGMRAGLPPFNAETYSNPSTVGGTAGAIANYKMAPLNGQALRTAQGQQIMAQVYAINPNYDATQYSTKAGARQAFATGTQGNTVRSLSVATDHLNQLGQAATALSNRSFKAYNASINYLQQQFGVSSKTSFDAMKEIVGDEVVKAVVGSSGAEGDRDAIKEAFASASSPEQLQGVIQKYKGLMGGQLNGLRRQYQKSTGLNDFNDLVSPAARSQLGGSTTGALGVGQSMTVGGFTVTRTQ